MSKRKELFVEIKQKDAQLLWERLVPVFLWEGDSWEEFCPRDHPITDHGGLDLMDVKHGPSSWKFNSHWGVRFD